jgi:hypothetical protein
MGSGSGRSRSPAPAVNRALARRLVQFHADPRAVDVSRILRVVRTTNSNWLNGAADDPTAYDFDAFARGNLPKHHADEDPEGMVHPRLIDERRNITWQDIIHRFSREHWHWGVLEDIRWLAEHRFPRGIFQEGQRQPVRPPRCLPACPRYHGGATVPRDRCHRRDVPDR